MTDRDQSALVHIHVARAGWSPKLLGDWAEVLVADVFAGELAPPQAAGYDVDAAGSRIQVKATSVGAMVRRHGGPIANFKGWDGFDQCAVVMFDDDMTIKWGIVVDKDEVARVARGPAPATELKGFTAMMTLGGFRRCKSRDITEELNVAERARLA